MKNIILFLKKYIKIQNFTKNPKITLRELCEHYKWSGPVGFCKAGFSGGLVIFGPVLPRFRPVPLPARPPKHFFCSLATSARLPHHFGHRETCGGGRGRWVLTTTKNTKQRSFRARKTHSYAVLVSRVGIIPFFLDHRNSGAQLYHPQRHATPPGRPGPVGSPAPRI